MSNLSKIDKNFEIKTNIGKNDVVFYNALNSPFKTYGVFYENGKFRRLPEKTAKSISDGVYALHANTAGGRIRFRTDSPYIAISAKMENVGKMSHFAFCGSAGFDLYVDNVHENSYIPPFDIIDGYEGVIDFAEVKMRDITINFPLYSDVCELYIGLKDGAEISSPAPYKIERPIVYYGSSITQGGCASRPGTSYQGFVSRHFDADFINLGFSGSARAEKEIYDYIKTLSMSAFVFDYDNNSPSTEHLESTHERMFLAIREANPTLPIVLMSRPKLLITDEEKKRFEIIKRTYQNAISKGDKNVYLIDGRELMRLAGNEGRVDGCHPTDLGFFSMADTLIKTLELFL